MAAAPPGAAIDVALAQLTQTQTQHSQTLAQHTQALAALTQTQTQHSQTLAQHTQALAALTQTQTQHTALLQQIIAQLGAIVNPAGLAATAQQILDARARNATTEDPAAPLTIMPLASGALPPHWPAAGLTRAALFRGPVAIVDELLGDYNIVPQGHAQQQHAERRNILARHLGTHRS